ncbi:MAG TPA: DUF4291 domain-containing protein [Ktedonobacterales bacterium]|nr:DUF4291 domain-containing protein [Ktedonobacterales bacterium]
MGQRAIRADYDERSLIVYQAYHPEIADAALRAGRFVEPFSLNRMTWIKPSFLWMMERCGWASKPGQERVLAIRISRAGWEEALSQAILTAFEPALYGDFDVWRSSLERAPARVQWDPERDLRGRAQERRAIQVGISRDLIARYVNEWTLEIRDATPLVRSLRRLLDDGRATDAQARLPRERLYPTPDALARHLGMD